MRTATTSSRNKGRVELQRLPADNDPLMHRIERIRARDRMFIDTLNQYYGNFSIDMWENYENWRKFNRAEMEAKRKAEAEATARIIGGIMLAALAAAAGRQQQLRGARHGGRARRRGARRERRGAVRDRRRSTPTRSRSWRTPSARRCDQR